MLRVEASNLPKPRGAPRPRRLLPNPPMPRRGAMRNELLPPADATASPLTELALPSEPTRPMTGRETWSVKLELGDEEIAKLYGQGMTRGAVVWKKGMLEWRPLLITPELTGLLRRTRITLPESSSPPSVAPVSARHSLPPDEPTVPRPARLPSFSSPSFANEVVVERSPIASVAPTALDVEPTAKPRRRKGELAVVGVAAFALAWMAHAILHPTTPGAVNLPAMAAAGPVAAPACEPSRTSSNISASTLSGSSIPTVSIADLPLAGSRGVAPTASRADSGRVAARSSASGASGNEKPSRSALVEALSQVARAASGCGERGGPVRVVVTFANSGVARSIQVSGADLPANTRSCMIGAASRARVPAFTGEPVTVSKTL
ncbi:MAG: hypothetical protein ABUL60_11690 [Myxococcales bacterium]